MKADRRPNTPLAAPAKAHPARRRFVSAMATALAGGGAFFGPWATNRLWAQSATPKPLVIGLTMDASGQYAASGGEERLGAMMAIKEFNDRGASSAGRSRPSTWTPRRRRPPARVSPSA